MGGLRRWLLVVSALVVAGGAAGCGVASSSPDRVEVQLERQLGGHPKFVECDRSDAEPDHRYTCRAETTADRYRYVATCPQPGRPCELRRTAVQLK
jgi:hypothetical protein